MFSFKTRESNFQFNAFLCSEMRKSKLLLILGFCLLLAASFISKDNWLYLKPKAGDSITKFLVRYQINDACSKEKFLEFNDLDENDDLLLDKGYKLPIKIETYNGTSIRTSLGIKDYNLAIKIQDYNLKMLSKKVRDTDYRKSMVLWVPIHLLNCKDAITSSQKEATVRTIDIPLFGKKESKVTISSNKLKGCVYYLVSGHGGPDPGAMTNHAGNSLCEDEYAYDVTLRLAKTLMEKGATVYMIIKDLNDGIREEKFLTCDKDEVCHPNLKIPYNQVKRLRQRTVAVNTLYLKHKKEAKKQRCIVIHVDSRSKKEQIDVFFYHHKNSKTGKNLANKLRNTFEKKYNEHQKGRGYEGEVSHRGLYMLTYTHPATCYIELGNIQHDRDRKRVEIKENREALANWIGEALVKE